MKTYDELNEDEKKRFDAQLALIQFSVRTSMLEETSVKMEKFKQLKAQRMAQKQMETQK